MDRTDYQILNILQADSRCTLRHIGDQVGLTPPAVSERIRRMEECGVIRSYRIDIDRTRLDCNITGFISVSLEPEKYAAFCVFCEQSPAVISHHHVIGVFNALLQFAVRDTKELDALLAEIKTYGDSRTSVELKTLFDIKEIPLPYEKRTKASRRRRDAFDISRRLRRRRGAAASATARRRGGRCRPPRRAGTHTGVRHTSTPRRAGPRR